mmetsp:Transcript_50793/g.169603  ORF Transcript_50793/g.169603 Transcript_50793/m.169603 type:complete len:219 (-) Transcript_50793:85-741(-)
MGLSRRTTLGGAPRPASPRAVERPAAPSGARRAGCSAGTPCARGGTTPPRRSSLSSASCSPTWRAPGEGAACSTRAAAEAVSSCARRPWAPPPWAPTATRRRSRTRRTTLRRWRSASPPSAAATCCLLPGLSSAPRLRGRTTRSCATRRTGCGRRSCARGWAARGSSRCRPTSPVRCSPSLAACSVRADASPSSSRRVGRRRSFPLRSSSRGGAAPTA